MDGLDRDFWLRYHAVDDSRRLARTHSFVLRCSDRFDLKLLASGDESTLLLRDRRAGVDHSVAWWNEAQAHPFALRWVELDLLMQRWRTSPTLAVPEPLLLLASFVGFGRDDAEQRAQARERVGDAYREIGFAPSDVAALVEHTVPDFGGADYQWSRDPDLGWVFSGEDPCYSLRNRAHVDGDEGQFPFSAFRELFG